MQKPKPKKHEECEECLEDAPLLMPVGIAPGFPVIVWPRLCLRCRLNTRSDKYAITADDLKHSKRQSARDAYPEWVKAEV